MAPRYPIREVLAVLRPEHPNLNISKIRWLEHQGRIRTVLDAHGRPHYDSQEVSAAMPGPDW